LVRWKSIQLVPPNVSVIQPVPPNICRHANSSVPLERHCYRVAKMQKMP